MERLSDLFNDGLLGRFKVYTFIPRAKNTPTQPDTPEVKIPSRD